MIAKVKKLHNAESDKSIKKKLLSILPDSWEVSRIVSESENVDLDSGEMTTNTLNPTKVPGNQPLKLDVKKLVIDCNESEENSKQLAGMKDFKSVKDCDGNRTRVQKKLILCNLKELYQSFKAQYNSVAIGFSKFASLRPTYCILAGSSGTHVVCVCTIHQNVKLMLEGCNFPKFAKNTDWVVESQPIYKNLLNKLVCNNPKESCFSRMCNSCPNNEEIADYFRVSFNESDVNEIQYKMWTSTDRCTIVNVTSDSEDFIDTLVTQLDKLLKHDFIAKTQSRFFSDTKLNLKSGEFTVVFDFAENYAFVVQEAAQGFHWNNGQATIFPMVIYYNENDTIKHLSFAASEDSIASTTDSG
ncbi:uncharacterized protein LOC123265492 [Cotesia glomerata]|uniref:uncharacterized protein LOC123265492 n=1 Tax=Cotesia glomerata TaxID=32391 RepID=UPI001D00B145|nr:uncharacterized protein LOC123265492 [Cotesia glomerata]